MQLFAANEPRGEQKAWFTEYSLFHFLSGYIWGRYMSSSLFTWLLVHTGFEIVENAPIGIQMFKKVGFRTYGGDCIQNSFGDTLCATAGYVLGNAHCKKCD